MLAALPKARLWQAEVALRVLLIVEVLKAAAVTTLKVEALMEDAVR